jgi:two-component system chemotaxis response regulator CheY
MHSLLIVDDSRISRQIIRKLLPSGDFEIREAADGRECLELYRQAPADLVFLDLTMPGWDGFETLRRLKEVDPGARVVVITADIQAGSRAKAMELGALEVISKPPKSEAINLAMEKYCS